MDPKRDLSLPEVQEEDAEAVEQPFGLEFLEEPTPVDEVTGLQGCDVICCFYSCVHGNVDYIEFDGCASC